MEIDGGSMLEEMVLFINGGDDLGMAVTNGDGDNTAEGVEVAVAFFVVKVLHRTFDQHEGFFIVVKKGWGEVFLAKFEHFFGGRSVVGLGLVRVGRQGRSLCGHGSSLKFGELISKSRMIRGRA
jgi:hypothetical protein